VLIAQGCDQLLESDPSVTGRRAPSGLGRRGRELWKDIVSGYELRADELELLEHACREVDLLERMQSELESAPMTIQGAYGQVVANPLVSEIRQHRTVLAGILVKLKLTDSAEAAAHSRSARISEAARKAARARWATGH
jgi:hypothetical protein